MFIGISLFLYFYNLKLISPYKSNKFLLVFTPGSDVYDFIKYSIVLLFIFTINPTHFFIYLWKYKFVYYGYLFVNS